ncbi:class I SAM-dependent methyltransferase [Bradyrhizobium sp. B097]|uniref:class I SAM-dependent methyltransferase n=1 Tax=Bradyrhizobium sp. B097 TaxID=3140244 RepID=UPI0031831881
MLAVSPRRDSMQDNQQTADHYTKQWSSDLGFRSFVQQNAEAAKAMPSRQLPWAELFERIRKQASERKTSVYDAACGFGDILNQLAASPVPANLEYVGADIHGALDTIERFGIATLFNHDITSELPTRQQFDFIVCRAAIHHTPSPRATFHTLVRQLAPGGTIAITAYAKKAPMREAVDDVLRAAIIPMPNDEAFATANQLTALGRDLQRSQGQITIDNDLPFLGIKAGTYDIQTFIYNHFIKCWHNPAFSEQHCDLVNFDWYHPPFAFRYKRDELREWAASCGLEIVNEASTEAQHYLECRSSR